MEALGIVGPFQGTKPRDILITKEEWNAASIALAEINLVSESDTK